MLIDEAFREQHSDEATVLVTECNELARSQVMPFDAPSGALTGVLILNSDETALPTVRKGRRLKRDAM